jgi:hypothetical protein
MRGTLADHLIALNNWLQGSPEGNVVYELNWEMGLEGPNHMAVHRATARCRFNALE